MMDFETPASTFDQPATFNIDGCVLRLTCSACPEQYDVFKGKQQIGYLRLRNGVFRADHPDCGDDTVYTAYTIGDGMFDGPGERAKHLSAAVAALRKAYRENAA